MPQDNPDNESNRQSCLSVHWSINLASTEVRSIGHGLFFLIELVPNFLEVLGELVALPPGFRAYHSLDLVCDRTCHCALPSFSASFFITGIERNDGNEQDAQHDEGHRNVEGERGEVCALPFPVLQVQIEAEAGHKQRT